VKQKGRVGREDWGEGLKGKREKVEEKNKRGYMIYVSQSPFVKGGRFSKGG